MRLSLLWIAVMLASVGAAMAQTAPVCMATADMRAKLATGYGEALVASGLDNRGIIMEVWANRRTESWTLIATQADGVSCLVATGHGFASIPVGDPA